MVYSRKPFDCVGFRHVFSKSSNVAWYNRGTLKGERPMKPRIRESARSEEVRDELRKQGFTIRWTAQEEGTRFSYWNNGVGKTLLLMEHLVDLKWQGWDIFVQLCAENNTAKTYAALKEFVEKDYVKKSQCEPGYFKEVPA
jgi:hypothetical protein